MPTGQSTTAVRPLRELICPSLEMPIEARPPGAERRQEHRFARILPGVLLTDAGETAVTCLDIGYGGVRVLAPTELELTRGTSVGVRINLGRRTFTDDYTVVESEPAPGGTTVHLRL